MKSLLSIIITTGLLASCSTPPKPTPFPKGKEVSLDNFQHLQIKKLSQKDTSNPHGWVQYFLAYTQPTEDNIIFWFYAQNSDKITIKGNINKANRLKRYMLDRGATKNICVEKASNKKHLNLIFIKNGVKHE